MTSDASYNTSRGELQVRSDWISKLGDCVERVVLHIDKDASDWLVPENPEYKCEYITRQVEVKAKYGLGVSKDEKKVMDKVLTGCVK